MAVKCTNCGAQIPEGKKFCTSCGTPAAGPGRCSHCGFEMGPGETFCSNCGARQGTAGPPGSHGHEARTSPPSTAASDQSRPPVQRAKGPAPDTEFKGIAPRFVAALIDGILYFVFAALVASRFGDTTSSASGGLDFSFNLQGIPAAITFIVGAAYYVLMEGFLGGTVGKLVLSMRVVDMRGEPPGLARALVRNLLRIADMLPLFYLLGIVLVASSREKQRLGDRIAGTFVVSRRGAAALRESGGTLSGAGTAGTVAAMAAALLFMLGGGYLYLSSSGAAGLSGVVPGLPGQAPKAGSGPTPVPAGQRSGQPVSSAPTQTRPTDAPSSAKPAATAAPTSATRPSPTTAPGGATAKVAPTPAGLTAVANLSQAELGGNWSGSFMPTSVTTAGGTPQERQKIEAEIATEVLGRSQSFKMIMDPKSNDSGMVTLDAEGDKLGPLSYRYQNGQLRFEHVDPDFKMVYEGRTGRKGSGFVVEGTLLVSGKESGMDITIHSGWSAVKP